MSTQDELEQVYRAQYDALEHDYYHGKTMTKAEFVSMKNKLAKRLGEDLKSIGAVLPPDWKALWLAADTIEKKLAIIAKRLELE